MGFTNITSVPVRRGAETGVITLDLGEFVIERVFKTKKKCALCKGKDTANCQGLRGIRLYRGEQY